MTPVSKYVCFIFIISAFLFNISVGHTCMNTPSQRGTLGGQSPLVFHVIDKSAPKDPVPHFPSGEKGSQGNGSRSQMEEYTKNGRKYELFEPMKAGFFWPAGVCGDLKGKVEDHRYGGRYYFGGKISASYEEGSTIDIDLSMRAHHGGFIQFHVCDVSKCDGEISEACFRTPGACKLLNRALNQDCESGANIRCGPIDKKHPSRWYFPCSLQRDAEKRGVKFSSHMFETFGPGSIQFQLPEQFRCEHCVLHWYWVTANSCNPPGLVEYFEGADRPVWSTCGYSNHLRTCGEEPLNIMPQQYFNCADIRIYRKGDSPLPTAPPVLGSRNGSVWGFERWGRSTNFELPMTWNKYIQ